VRTRTWAPYALIAPTLALMAVFLVYPIASVGWFSLRQHTVTQPWKNGFIGFENFRRMLFDDPLFWQSLMFSAKWVVVEVGLQLVLGLCLALIVNETFVGRAMARSLVFSPWAVSGVLTTGIWILLYNPSTGIFQQLAQWGIGDPGTSVLGDPATVFPATVVTELWRGVPFFAILLLADLQTIPNDLYEAASVDGAGASRKFLKITLPMLSPVIFFNLLLEMIHAFQIFASAFIISNGTGGPARSTLFYTLYLYFRGFQDFQMGYAAAMAWILVIVVGALAAVFFWSSKHWVHYSGEGK
jgi:multiple sugar transport system permease protein